jgi:N-acyl-L-homoserine lactone synthetase
VRTIVAHNWTTMLANTFPVLLGDNQPPYSARIFESFRFWMDTSLTEDVAPAGRREASFGLLAAVLEWGLLRGQKAVVTVTDIRFEPIPKRAGWPPNASLLQWKSAIQERWRASFQFLVKLWKMSERSTSFRGLYS